jgi:hypothetical protein
MSTITTATLPQADTQSAPSAVDVLLEASKLLSPQQRKDFFDRFTEVWDDDKEEEEGPPLSSEWMEEIQCRVAEDEAGLSVWTDAEEVLRKARESLSHSA